MGKKQIFDIVLVFNEYDLLQERFELLENYVDKFIVFDFGSGCKNFSTDNIIHIKSPKFYLDKDFNLAYEALKQLEQKNLYVEDVLRFSKANELPDMEVFINNLHLLNYKPVVCQQKKVFWVGNMMSKKIHFGTFAIKYSDFIRNQKVYNSMLNLMSPVFVNHETLSCGWQFNGFQSAGDFEESQNFWGKANQSSEIYDELFLGLKDFDGNLLIEKSSNIPENLFKLQRQLTLREPKKFHLTTDERVFHENDDLTLLISQGKIISNQHFEHFFEIPTLNYYGVDDFVNSYSKNEVLKVLQKLGALKHDIITYQKKETLDKVSLTYQEFQNFVPSELF